MAGTVYEGQTPGGLTVMKSFSQPRARAGVGGFGGPTEPPSEPPSGGSASLNPKQFPGRPQRVGLFAEGGLFEKAAHAVNVVEDLKRPGGWRTLGALGRGELAYRPRAEREELREKGVFGEALPLSKRLELLQMQQFPGMQH